MKSKFKAMVLSCIDPRFQHLVHNHLKKKKLTGKYSAFTIAGAAKIANGKKEFSPANEKKIHQDSFKKLKKEIKKRFPKLKVELNVIALDSKITKF